MYIATSRTTCARALLLSIRNTIPMAASPLFSHLKPPSSSSPLPHRIHGPKPFPQVLSSSSSYSGRSPFSSLASVSFSKPHKRIKPPVAALHEIGGVKIAKDDVVRESDPTNNVPENIFSKIGLQLHRRDNHPLGILKNAIYDYFDASYSSKFVKFDDLCPIVSVQQNFDEVLVPTDHISRSYNDTYYVNTDAVLRCHTSAHQAELLREGHSYFLVTGDVYRRDSIDSTHYPVFHQMEGVRVFAPDEWKGSGTDAASYAAMDLKKCLEGLARHLFGAVEMRWVDTYFPFTNPSFELEIYFQEKWMEVLGCGVTEQEILDRNGRKDCVAWAFGLGLERLAMVLFDIPDIRLFWSTDQRFTSQFSEGKLGVKFKQFSKFPPCYKDISFWISDSFTENNLCEVVRGIAGDLVEEVKLIDNFTNKKGMTSHCYRIAFRSMERSLADEEINEMQWNVREAVKTKLHVTLRFSTFEGWTRESRSLERMPQIYNYFEGRYRIPIYDNKSFF